MTSAQVVETSVNVISNSPSQDYTYPDDRTLLYDMTPGFEPFTILITMLQLPPPELLQDTMKLAGRDHPDGLAVVW